MNKQDSTTAPRHAIPGTTGTFLIGVTPMVAGIAAMPFLPYPLQCADVLAMSAFAVITAIRDHISSKGE